jgi:dienelactone hydrolase
MRRRFDLPNSGLEVWQLRFPSPVTSECLENNTVYADYYLPKGSGHYPCAIVLDITAGDQSVSRSIATHLAQNRVAALFVQMAYYGPRRPPGSRLRLLSTDVPHTMAAVRQTVLDLRRATAWMQSRPEIDRLRLGIVGTSLGSLVGTLTAEMEPRITRVVVLLGGGGLVDAYYDYPRAAPARMLWEALGGNKQKLADLIAPVDPLTCAANLRDRKVLMVAGSRDEIIPPKATLALWKAAGQQEIIWYDCTHLGAALYFAPAMEHVVKHLGAP